MERIIFRSIGFGIAGTALLFIFYFVIVSLVSGSNFAVSQFFAFRYFIVSLAVGFGVQVGLYGYLKSAMREQKGMGRVLAVSGTTSTAAMVSCCAHYLANILPVIGVAGVISIIGQYQTELFWIGLAFNAGGIAYIARKVIAFNRI